MLFDTHAHYDDERFSNDADELLSSMNANNVGPIMNSCSSTEDIPRIFELAERYPFVYASVGIHPSETENLTENDMNILAEAAAHPKVKAIGEIGLDYYYNDPPRDIQKKWFARQIDLARELNLPIIIHDRDAHSDTLSILREHHAEDIGGVFHCYSGSAEMVREVLDLNMYVAFGGTLTFKKSVRPAEAAKAVPLDRILIETDSPYLTPEPHRGKRNSSLYIHYVAEKLADILDMSCDDIEKITAENGLRCFNIQEDI